MPALAELLQTRFDQLSTYAPLEALRNVVLASAGSTYVESANCVVQWVSSSPLRSLFLEMYETPPPAVGAGLGAIAQALGKNAPSRTALEAACVALGMRQAEASLLRRQTEATLPHLRVVGYLALLCRCVQLREVAYGG